MPRFSPMDGLLGLSIPYPEQCELAFVELGETIQKTFIESIEDYLAFCTERNEAPEKPFSGRFNLRLEPDIHRDAYLSARKAGMSLNSWVKNAIIHAVHNVSQSPSPLPGLHKSR